MQFQCETTDGPAQIGKLDFNNKEIVVPNILFPANSSYDFPPFKMETIGLSSDKEKNKKSSLFCVGNSVFFKDSDESKIVNNFFVIPESLPTQVTDYLLQYDDQKQASIQVIPSDETLASDYIKQKKIQLLIVSNAYQLYRHPKKCVSYIQTIRSQCNYDSIIFFPGVAHPSNIALLSYSGIDLFDASKTIIASRHKQFYLPDTSSVHINSIQENPCMCPVCTNSEKSPVSFSFEELLKHNSYMLWQELLSVRHAIRNHQLRDLVEKRIRNSPDLVTTLRYLDSIADHYLEERTAMSSSESYTLQTTSREAGFRPEIKRFQKRIISRYQKPKDKKILLLLPCSAKKPYSFSKSHQRFNRVISSIKNNAIIHEIIITSPLGLVPRELELTYPASSYDISVTGSWYEDEIAMIQTLLDTYLEKNHYDAIVSHLPENLICPSKKQKQVWHQCLQSGKASSQHNLKRLQDLLFSLTSTTDYEPISKAKQKQIQIQAIARYQFGLDLGDALTDNIMVKGKYPFLKFFDNQGEQLGMIPEGRGLISLTAEGGNRISVFDQYRVTINTGFTVKGSILAPGVITADDQIRIGDDVTVFQGGSYLGVGTAQMNGSEMIQRQYGIAVNMRHKIK